MRRIASHAYAVALVACIALALSAAFAQSPSTHQHRFSGAERWAQVFDDPKRDVWQKPDEVMRALELPPDALAADIGAGTGYFAVRLADALPAGRVYAVDVEPDMVEYLGARAKREKKDNLFAVAGAPDDPRLPERVDLILLVNVFHHVDDRVRYFRGLETYLRPGGRIAIIDFRPESPTGPPRATRIAVEQVKAELENAGYALAHRHDFLPNQYFLVFEAKR